MNDGEDEKFDALAVVSGGAAVVDISRSASRHMDFDKIRSRVLVLRDEMGDAYFELGRLLYRINRDGLYVNWEGPDGSPYKSFYDYVEFEVDFAFRKAKYLMSIWWWFAEELGDQLVMEKIKQVGWTKAAMLVGVVDSQNADVWISKAKNTRVKELRDQTRFAMEVAARGRRPERGSDAAEPAMLPLPMPENPTFVPPADQFPVAAAPVERKGIDPLSDEAEWRHRSKWIVKLTGEQRSNVEMAIDVAHHVAESQPDGKGYLLDLIATSFLAFRGGTVGNSKPEDKVNFRNSVLRAVGQTFDVDIIAIERGTGRPLFGKNVIDRLAGGSDVGES